METLTLKELKEQNAKLESPEEETPKDEIEEVLEGVEQEIEVETDPKVEDEYIEVNPETEEPIEAEDKTEEEEEDEQEAWQVSEKAEDSQDGKKTGFVPNAAAKALRLKNKALKQEKKEQNAELEQLRAEVEALKQVKQPNVPVVSDNKMPTLESCDYDEAKYQAEMAKFIKSQVEDGLNSHQQNLQSQEELLKVEQAKQARKTAVMGMYENAATLINDSKISEDKWDAADSLIRNTIDAAMPGQGDEVADVLIANLSNSGSGSEKVWYYLGNNAKELNQLMTSLKNDPSGLSASIFLGRVQEKVTRPIQKKRSSAPAPAETIKGDAPNTRLSALKKEYEKLGEIGDIEARIKLKRKAKAKGVDTSQW